MNSQPNSKILPPLDSHRQGLKITLRVGRKLVSSSVGGLGAHSVYQILHQNVGSLIASWILNQIPKFHHHWIPTVKGYKSHSGLAENRSVHRLVHLVHTRSTHHQGLQITLQVGRKPVGSSVGGLGAHLVYWILHESIGLLIASWILSRIPKFHHHWIPTVNGYKSHSRPAKNRSIHRLVHLVHTQSTEFCMKTSARS